MSVSWVEMAGVLGNWWLVIGWPVTGEIPVSAGDSRKGQGHLVRRKVYFFFTISLPD
jgi:hypothetical protein